MGRRVVCATTRNTQNTASTLMWAPNGDSLFLARVCMYVLRVYEVFMSTYNTSKYEVREEGGEVKLRRP